MWCAAARAVTARIARGHDSSGKSGVAEDSISGPRLKI